MNIEAKRLGYLPNTCNRKYFDGKISRDRGTLVKDGKTV